jgi:hypothetical protein
MKIRRVDGFVMLTTVLIMTVVVVLLLVGQLWLQTNEAWSMRCLSLSTRSTSPPKAENQRSDCMWKGDSVVDFASALM